MGSRIVHEAVLYLQEHMGMNSSALVVLSGSSAGAEGVWPNVDAVAQMVPASTRVLGLADSGWFIDAVPFHQGDCRTVGSCTEQGGLQRGMPIWRGRVNAGCAAAKTAQTLWQCMMGYYAYPFVKTPTFVFQVSHVVGGDGGYGV